MMATVEQRFRCRTPPKLLPRHILKSIASQQHILITQRVLFMRLMEALQLSGDGYNFGQCIESIMIIWWC